MSKKSREEALSKAADSATEDPSDTAMVPENGDGTANLATTAKAQGAMLDLTQMAQRTALLKSDEQMEALELAMGIDKAEIETIAAGSLPFWPAFPGAMIIGTVQSSRQVPTRFKTPNNPKGLVTLYTVAVEKSCLAGTLDGEIYETEPGDLISVLERAVLKELATRIGQKVGILCVGKKEGKEFSYWDYKIVGKRRSPQEIQASAQLAMANTQVRALPEARG
jgi:hypothetical protein